MCTHIVYTYHSGHTGFLNLVIVFKCNGKTGIRVAIKLLAILYKIYRTTFQELENINNMILIIQTMKPTRHASNLANSEPGKPSPVTLQ